MATVTTSKMRCWTVQLLLVGTLGVPTWAQAQNSGEVEGGPGLHVNGFATLGITDMSTERGSWTFVRDLSQSVLGERHAQTLTDSRIGLQVSGRLNPQTDWAVQGLLKKSVTQHPVLDRVELAFVSYSLTPQTRVRIGRTNPDMFLLSDHRNVGFAYPWVRPNHDFYSWMPLGSVDGVELTHDWQQNEANWQVRGMWGRSQVSLSKVDAAPRADTPQFASLSLTREAHDLTLKASWAFSRLNVSGIPYLDALSSAIAPAEQLPLPSVVEDVHRLRAQSDLDTNLMHYLSLGLKYDSTPWLVHAELSRVSGSPGQIAGTHRYLSVGYRQGPLTYFVMTGRAKSQANSLPTPQWQDALAPYMGALPAAQLTTAGVLLTDMVNGIRYDQRSYSLGLRWDIDTRVSLKLQHDLFVINPCGSMLWGLQDTSPNRAKVWSAVVDMVF